MGSRARRASPVPVRVPCAGGGCVKPGDTVRVGKGSATATVLQVLSEKDTAGDPYQVALLRGARGREFREETSRLTVVKKAGVK